MALSYYKNLYTSPLLASGNFLSGAFPTMLEGSARLLSREFTKEEVMRVLKDMGPLKIHGLNGFQVIFFKKCQSSVGDDISDLF